METLNQKSLAAFLGISQQYLSDIKTGKKTLGKKSALRISKITGIDFQELSFLEGDAFLKKTTLAMVASRIAKPRKRARRSSNE